MKHFVRVLFLLTVTALTLSANATSIKFETDVLVKKSNENNFVTIKKEEKIDLNEDVLMVVAENGYPLIVVNAKNDTEIILKNKNLDEVFKKQTKNIVNKNVNDIITSLRKAESFLVKKDYQQANSILSNLKQNYAENSAVYFLSASANALLNNKTQAIDDLNAGLAIEPDNINAQNLLKKIKGVN